ncbi:U4/U6.U5 snRNP associated protein [Malassezia equina]|uniref:U4/U6.U5 snRNP associated protein n=1 Tax=Malassezia equina TaxID=1381935 RepID=A0AAF0IZ51_9BASI|nr:U4/U6.U5 snRNP associated protein [Malassezia equina]
MAHHEPAAGASWDPAQASASAPPPQRSAPVDLNARRRRKELPKPTKAMQAHDDLKLDELSGTTRLVDHEDSQGRGPGFFCEVCKKMCKDSVGYLDHINGRMHLRRLGQTTQAERATLEQVRERIAAVRAERALGATPAQRYDFDARLKQIAEEQRRERQAQRRDKRDERLRKRQKQMHEAPQPEEDADVMAAMGFGSFRPKR